MSVAEAARRLGIDSKTLRRWVAEAQLPLHSHPGDGRKKGMSQEQLEQLAHLHHRSLALSPQQSLALVPGDPFPLPAPLLALPETIGVLQAQIAALQQQVAELSSLLQQVHQSASPLAQPKRPSHRLLTSPSSASRARPANIASVKTPAKPVHVIPRVEYGPEGRYVVICPKRGVLPFEPDTQEWFAWVSKQDSFRFVGKAGHFTAHHEWRVPKGAWRAHRHIRNHVYVRRLAPNHELTIALLEQVAEALQALST
jgi:transposase-like protein